jgi:hypothetical protein
LELLTCQNINKPTEIVVFPKKDPDTHCNGKVHLQERYCRKEAGWGTTHFGTGRCKLHGGCNTGKGSGQLRYSDFVSAELLDKYEEYSVEATTDIKSLNDEIGLIRAKIAYLLKHPTYYDNDLLLKFTEVVRRLVETKQKVEEGIKHKVTIEVAVKILNNVVKVINERVQDPDIKRLISKDIRGIDFESLIMN